MPHRKGRDYQRSSAGNEGRGTRRRGYNTPGVRWGAASPCLWALWERHAAASNVLHCSTKENAPRPSAAVRAVRAVKPGPRVRTRSCEHADTPTPPLPRRTVLPAPAQRGDFFHCSTGEKTLKTYQRRSAGSEGRETELKRSASSVRTREYRDCPSRPAYCAPGACTPRRFRFSIVAQKKKIAHAPAPQCEQCGRSNRAQTIGLVRSNTRVSRYPRLPAALRHQRLRKTRFFPL